MRNAQMEISNIIRDKTKKDRNVVNMDHSM